MTTPAPPWPVVYAIARSFLENRRTLEFNRSRKRSQDFVGASAVLTSLGHLTAHIGLGRTSVSIHAYASDVIRELPIDAGTDWLHAGSERLAELLLKG